MVAANKCLQTLEENYEVGLINTNEYVVKQNVSKQVIQPVKPTIFPSNFTDDEI